MTMLTNAYPAGKETVQLTLNINISEFGFLPFGLNLFPASNRAAPTKGATGDPKEEATNIIPMRKAL